MWVEPARRQDVSSSVAVEGSPRNVANICGKSSSPYVRLFSVRSLGGARRSCLRNLVFHSIPSLLLLNDVVVQIRALHSLSLHGTVSRCLISALVRAAKEEPLLELLAAVLPHDMPPHDTLIRRNFLSRTSTASFPLTPNPSGPDTVCAISVLYSAGYLGTNYQGHLESLGIGATVAGQRVEEQSVEII